MSSRDRATEASASQESGEAGDSVSTAEQAASPHALQRMGLGALRQQFAHALKANFGEAEAGEWIAARISSHACSMLYALCSMHGLALLQDCCCPRGLAAAHAMRLSCPAALSHAALADDQEEESTPTSASGEPKAKRYRGVTRHK